MGQSYQSVCRGNSLNLCLSSSIPVGLFCFSINLRWFITPYSVCIFCYTFIRVCLCLEIAEHDFKVILSRPFLSGISSICVGTCPFWCGRTLFGETLIWVRRHSSSETQGQILGPRTKIKKGRKKFDEQKYERKMRAPGDKLFTHQFQTGERILAPDWAENVSTQSGAS